MNFYVVTEGNESKVYKKWVTYINPHISVVDKVDMVRYNNCYFVSGGGFPYYLEVIEKAIEDVNLFEAFNRLVIFVDSEDQTKDNKFLEIQEYTSGFSCRIEIRIVVQHFCFETWGLGNKKIINPNSQSERLRKYRHIYDVREDDPECLPALISEELNRSQFAEIYLRTAINDKWRNLTYTKKDPSFLEHRSYFDKLKSRLNDTGHIASFNDLLRSFI